MTETQKRWLIKAMHWPLVSAYAIAVAEERGHEFEGLCPACHVYYSIRKGKTQKVAPQVPQLRPIRQRFRLMFWD
jgi:hypothetical protein